ncbi:hypothetical protein RYX36_007699 [Vicia faba]
MKHHVSNPKLWLIVGLGLVGGIVVPSETHRRRRCQNTPKQDFGAFIEWFELLPFPQPPPPSAKQTLSSLTFSISDVFDVKGYVTGFRNPLWKKTHDEAEKTTFVVTALLFNEATCVGKTVMDEFSFGFSGENKYYGTPINPKMPACVPGGSSGGSAVAVAAGLVDFSIGTITTGCVRIPASLYIPLKLNAKKIFCSEFYDRTFALSSIASMLGVVSNPEKEQPEPVSEADFTEACEFPVPPVEPKNLQS